MLQINCCINIYYFRRYKNIYFRIFENFIKYDTFMLNIFHRGFINNKSKTIIAIVIVINRKS